MLPLNWTSLCADMKQYSMDVQTAIVYMAQQLQGVRPLIKICNLQANLSSGCTVGSERPDPFPYFVT